MDGFRAGNLRVLVATDLAARGIDVDGISHVYNFELPDVAETYVHRIGRTARAGASGCAIALCDREEKPLLRAIEKLLRTSVPVASGGVFDLAAAEGRKAAAAEVKKAASEPRAADSRSARPREGWPQRKTRVEESRPRRDGQGGSSPRRNARSPLQRSGASGTMRTATLARRPG